MSSILPANSTEFERALEKTVSRILPERIETLWNPDTCPVEFLGYLAWGLAIDIWDDQWTETTKRDVVRQSIHVHQHRGTPGALKQALQAMGYRYVEIIEGQSHGASYNGASHYSGATQYGGAVAPFEFDVILHTQNQTTNAEITEIKRRINAYKNARSHLRQLKTYNALYDGTTTYNGNKLYNGGII